jgi:pilus assembly protein Flp/PilA
MLVRTYTDLELRVRDFGTKVAKRSEGATAVEYALMVALIAVVIIAAVTLLGSNLRSRFSQVATTIGPGA